MKNIYLIGFMGTGKTSVSGKLALLTGMKAIELDSVIEQESNLSISEIFAIHGEEYFRNLENRALKKFVNSESLVISCGGGIVLRNENTSLLKSAGNVILLEATAETIFERIKNSTHRPILKDNMTISHISILLEKRKPYYYKAADIIINTDGLFVSQIAQNIINELKL